jgi:hypothetical protein
MKKLNFLTFVLIFISIAACKKSNTDNTDLNNLTYSSNSPSQSKSDIENTGANMVTQMSNLNKEAGTQATVNLISLLSNSSSSSISAITPAFSTLKAAALLGNGTSGTSEVFASLRQTTDDIGLLQVYDSIAGIYTYNFNTGNFDKKASSTFSIIFPATIADKKSNSNTGIFEIARPTVQTGPFNLNGATINELPTSIQYDIKVNNTVSLNYQFTASYNTDGMPTSVSSDLTIGTFLFNTSWSYQTADVKLNYSIKNSSTTMVDMGWEMTGNFDKTNIQNYTNSTSENPDPTAILTNANAHFQFYNIKIAGQINFKDFYNGLLTIEKETKADTLIQQEELDLINKNIALVVVYADNNQMIAKAEAYLKPYQYTDWVYNPSTEYYEPETVTNDEIDMRMVFSDKSKSDLNTYFQSGFSSLTGDFNTFIGELNSTYGWNIQSSK